MADEERKPGAKFAWLALAGLAGVVGVGLTMFMLTARKPDPVEEAKQAAARAQINEMLATTKPGRPEVSPEEKAIFKKITDARAPIHARYMEIVKTYLFVVEKLENAEEAKTSGATSDRIDKCIVMINDAEENGVKLDAFLADFEKDYNESLVKAGIEDERRAKEILDWTRLAKFDQTGEMRKVHRDYYAAMKAKFVVLKENWGKWRVGTDGEVTFDDQGQASRYQEAVERVNKAEDEREALVEEDEAARKVRKRGATTAPR